MYELVIANKLISTATQQHTLTLDLFRVQILQSFPAQGSDTFTACHHKP